jgi:drug/metabolite transporter (DMT)-like permease
MLLRLAPALFVLLWSTGFIGSKLGAADAEPFTFLSMRFVLAILVLLPVALLRGSLKEDWRRRGHAALVGALIHGGYLGGVFWAIRHGMPAGVAALIVSLQPILTSVLAGPLLGEKLAARHWAGLALGLLGALLIVGPKLGGANKGVDSGVDGATLAAALIALLAITLGTLYQKRFGAGVDLVGGAIWQYLGALAIVGSAAMLFETRAVTWSPKFIFALGWLVMALSIGAILLLMLLIRQHAVSGVSGLFYLVPPCTAVMAYVMFDERLTMTQIIGMAIAIAGVILIAGRRPASVDDESVVAIPE